MTVAPRVGVVMIDAATAVLVALRRAHQASLAQLDRVVHKANEYRLFGHGLACYFVDRLSDWPALQARSAQLLPLMSTSMYEVCTDDVRCTFLP